MKAIVFDVDDTLYDLCWPYKMAVEKRFGDEYDEIIEKLFMASRVHSDEVFEDWSSGRMSSDDMYAHRNQQSFADFGINISRETALEIQSYYKEFQKQISMTDTVKTLLAELKKMKVPMGCITNGSSANQGAKVKTLGITEWIPEKNIIISGAVGAAKPGSEIYGIAEKRLEIDRSEAWYVGDTFANDVIGAKKAGWHSIWFNRRYNEIPDIELTPDRIVYSEKDMVNAVMQLVTE
ncbi:MAG: HAD family hydrolase [Lachnospiraceae bacterium]|nr:HAD family hydrolase [Lachnospiraceae bacterium]